MPGPSTSPRRADAQRNRERLLAAATASFAAGDEHVALDQVAKRAGVGIGTLYRHFPTREALVEAVYRSEQTQLRERAEQLLADKPPDVALRLWMDRFAEWVYTKRGMIETLRAVVASGAIVHAESRKELVATVGTLLGAGVAAGTLRADAKADDVLASITGVLLAAKSRAQAGRMFDLLAAGLRTS